MAGFMARRWRQGNSENYSITQVEINTHNIFRTVMVAIFAPQFLPAIVGIASNSQGVF